jgi:hypothetical protein
MIDPKLIVAVVAAAGGAFSKILPPGFELAVHHDALTLTTTGILSVHYLAENIGHRLEADYQPLDAIQDAVVSFARDLQDDVTARVTYPWPRDPGLGKSDFAYPHSEIRNGTLTVWFGKESDALTPPIRIPLPAELLEV